MADLARIAALVDGIEGGEGGAVELVEHALLDGGGLPLGVRLRLCEQEGIEATALASALIEIVGATERPTGLTVRVASMLLERQGIDGSFGSVHGTAIAVRAVCALDRQIAGIGAYDRYSVHKANPQLAARLGEAVVLAGQDLEMRQQGWGGFVSRGLIGDELESLIALCELARCPAGVVAVDLGALTDALVEAGAAHMMETAGVFGEAVGALAREAA